MIRAAGMATPRMTACESGASDDERPYRLTSGGMTSQASMDRADRAGLDRVGNDFRDLLDTATIAELGHQPKTRAGTTSSRSSTCCLVSACAEPVRSGEGVLPRSDATSKRFAAILNAARDRSTSSTMSAPVRRARPGTRPHGTAHGPRSRACSCPCEASPSCARTGNAFCRLGPLLQGLMKLRDVYHYPTEALRSPRRQLTLARARA